MYFLNLMKTSHKSCGFTLIECIISIAIFEIIFGIEAVFLFRIINNFNVMTSQNKNMYYSNEAFTFIKHEIDTSLSCKVLENDVIEITQKNSSIKKYIKLDQNHNLVIYNGNPYGYNNYILKKVKEFNVRENGSVIYIKIVDKEGKNYKRCFGIKRKKVL